MLLRRKALQQCCYLPGELAWHTRVVTARKEHQGRQQPARIAWQLTAATHQPPAEEIPPRFRGCQHLYPRGKGYKLALFDSNTLVVMLEPHGRHNDIPLFPY